MKTWIIKNNVKLWPVLNFPGYYISKCGKVWSEKGQHQGKFLQPYAVSKYGHLSIRLYKNEISYNQYIHRLLLETFIGPCPNGMETCHNDGNPQNNDLSNLRWDTRNNNAKDAIKHGTHIGTNRGEQQGSAKLTNQQVRRIKRMCRNRLSKNTEIARMFKVHPATISAIKSGRNWKHIKI